MTKISQPDFFTKELAQAYDERNSKLVSISENMHFLIQIVLKSLPQNANILCVGVGTGAEIISLSKIFPGWTFVGVDPSASMLEVCKVRLKDAGVLNRCQLLQGYVQDVATGENFDAALSLLVGHFIKSESRLDFFQNMTSRLKKGGYLVNVEISYDLNSPEFLMMLKNWEQIQTLMGATSESLASLPMQLREMLTILPGPTIEDFFRRSQISNPVKFFQAFMISGWYGQKSVL